MTPGALLRELKARRVEVAVKDSDLSIRAPHGAMDDGLRESLREHKATLMALLTTIMVTCRQCGSNPWRCTCAMEPLACVVCGAGSDAYDVAGLPCCVGCTGADGAARGTRAERWAGLVARLGGTAVPRQQTLELTDEYKGYRSEPQR